MERGRTRRSGREGSTQYKNHKSKCQWIFDEEAVIITQLNPPLKRDRKERDILLGTKIEQDGMGWDGDGAERDFDGSVDFEIYFKLYPGWFMCKSTD